MQLRAAADQPCVRFRFSRRLGRLLPRRPAVDCGRACTACPWNPEEQARRLAVGLWRRDEKRLLGLHFPPVPRKNETGGPAREGEAPAGDGETLPRVREPPADLLTENRAGLALPPRLGKENLCSNTSTATACSTP